MNLYIYIYKTVAAKKWLNHQRRPLQKDKQFSRRYYSWTGLYAVRESQLWRGGPYLILIVESTITAACSNCCQMWPSGYNYPMVYWCRGMVSLSPVDILVTSRPSLVSSPNILLLIWWIDWHTVNHVDRIPQVRPTRIRPFHSVWIVRNRPTRQLVSTHHSTIVAVKVSTFKYST
jgi:hypothetical protein